MNNHKIWGIESEAYAKLASSHSKTNIILWVTTGFIYHFFNDNLHLLSVFLIIFPGIFIASFASILTFWVNVKKIQIIQRTNNFFILLGFTIWYIIDLLFPIILSIIYIKTVDLLF